MFHINQFVDRLKAANSRNQRDFTMSIAEARNLHADITKLLIVLEEYREKSMTMTQNNATTTVEMDGGSF